jgi:hypothetical protein
VVGSQHEHRELKSLPHSPDQTIALRNTADEMQVIAVVRPSISERVSGATAAPQ